MHDNSSIVAVNGVSSSVLKNLEMFPDNDAGDSVEDAPLGAPLPPDDIYAVSVSLPRWRDAEGWARKEDETINAMRTGYPRFFIQPLIQGLAEELNSRFGPPGTRSIILSSQGAALRCYSFISAKSTPGDAFRVGRYSLCLDDTSDPDPFSRWTCVHVVWFDEELSPHAKAFWQHTGEGISSRHADYCRKSINSFKVTTGECCFPPVEKLLVPSKPLDDKSLIRDRIAACADPSGEVDPDRDVFLYPAGMKAIFDVTRAISSYLHHVKPGPISMVSYGFLYVDTMKVLSNFGTNDTIVYGFGSSAELDELEDRLKSGTSIGALYTEFPTNPLLTCIDLQRVRRLADTYDFVVVCDDTVGTSVNVEILPLVDVLVTSLTKLFSGACNAMGGSAILNPRSKHYGELHKALSGLFEDTYFPEDARVMAKNCADFPQRVRRINGRAQDVASLLHSRPALVKRVYYPSIGPSPPETKQAYDLLRRRRRRRRRPDDEGDGGYGYLLTTEFVSPAVAVAFYDALRVAKGPSLGTNFTLACPCTLFAHYEELDAVAGYGVVEHLVRISVGLEEDVVERVRKALDAAAEVVMRQQTIGGGGNSFE